jgi:hypothetical protein
MTARQVTWFIDPEALLRHLGDLQTLGLAAFCQHCYEKGLPDDVTATFDPQTRTWQVHCACADYPVIHDRGDGAMATTRETDTGTEKVFMRSVDELLFRLGWSFKCVGDCARLGMHDGVQGENDPQGSSVKVVCGCRERVYAEPGRA